MTHIQQNSLQSSRRSPYFLQTDKGNIELSKGMYLCLLRKKRLSGLKTKKKIQGQQNFEQIDNNTSKNINSTRKTISRLCHTHRSLELRKIITKTTKKMRYQGFSGSIISAKKLIESQQQQTQKIFLASYPELVTLLKDSKKYSFQVYDEKNLFPKQLSQFYIPIDYDNDCESDEQQIQKSLNNVLLSLCLAAYQQTYLGIQSTERQQQDVETYKNRVK